MPPRWQILIPTIPHRHAKLSGLLRQLDAQMQLGVQVVVYRDNLETSYAGKLQALMDAATGVYVSVLSDDDGVCPDFLPRVYAAMDSGPDQVGFRVRYTEAGVRQQPVIHSLTCGGWSDGAAELRRDIMYFNPVRRELAQRARFRGPYCDAEWAEDLRALGCIQTEVFIDAEMLYYQRDAADNFHTPRQPAAAGQILPLPRYCWLAELR
jgi:hypothetical protein